jgi:hypothetical protein
MRTTTVRDVGEYEDVIWFSSIPELPGSHCVTHPGRSGDADWVSLERPRIPQRPQPPSVLWGWLLDDREPTSEPELRELEPDEEFPNEVVEAYDAFLDDWREWTRKYGPQVPLVALYERLFRIRQQADQLGERYETVVAAGLAVVTGGERGRVRRHLLTMRVELHYEAQTGRITVRPAADGIGLQLEDEMLDPGLLPSQELRGSVLTGLGDAGADIWTGTVLVDALTTWTLAMRHDATFSPALEAPVLPHEGVSVALAPALILRKRTSRSLLAFYHKVDTQLDAGTLSLGLVAGLVAEPDDEPPSGSVAEPQDHDELYFPKPYNSEQLDVLRRLGASDGVVVVGPPGTGKSHTIANLVSHLLAHGQRVLVTSHTSRALEVLLDKLPDEMRWLSVSLVGDGRAGMRELQRSVTAIVNRSTDPDWQPHRIDERINRIRGRRDQAHQERRRHLAAIREVREGDAKQHEAGLGRYQGTLSEIAARLADEGEVLGWASGAGGDLPPLTDAEASELVALARTFTPEVESSARVPLPELPTPEDFAQLCGRLSDMAAVVASSSGSAQSPSAGVLGSSSHADRIALAQAIDRMQRGRAIVAMADAWELAAFDGALGGSVAKWRERKVRTEEWVAALHEAAPVADHLIITGSLGAEPVTVRAAVEALIAHLEAGHGLGIGPFKPKVVKDAQAALGSVRIDGQAPTTPPVLTRLRTWLGAKIATDAACAAWVQERALTDESVYSVLANLEELQPALDRVLAAEQCRTDIQVAVARIPGLAVPPWADQDAWSRLRLAALAIDAGAALAEVQNELARLRTKVEDLAVTDPGDLVPVALAAIESRDPKAFAAARAAAEER